MTKISILGSTGSIGTQTLEVVSEQSDLKVVGLTANKNIDLLEEQIKRYHPEIVAVMDRAAAQILKSRVGNLVQVVSGIEGLIEVATISSADIIVTAVVGMIGLRPTVAAIKAGKDIALANKETLVTAGELIMKLVNEYQVKMIPVDSEHSAIYQSLVGESLGQVEKILLTASGGPFRGCSSKDLEKVELKDALNHPNWSMGPKITCDSSTLMNKGLEVIEAKWLFGVDLDCIEVVVHPQSIIHSMVQFIDGSIIGQMGLPDMKLPIQYALFQPERRLNNYKRLDLTDIGTLTFEKPDTNVFPCLQYAYDALEVGGTMPTVLNAANEKAVSMFMADRIHYTDIPKIIKEAMDAHEVMPADTLESILAAEQWTYSLIESRY